MGNHVDSIFTTKFTTSVVEIPTARRWATPERSRSSWCRELGKDPRQQAQAKAQRALRSDEIEESRVQAMSQVEVEPTVECVMWQGSVAHKTRVNEFEQISKKMQILKIRLPTDGGNDLGCSDML